MTLKLPSPLRPKPAEEALASDPSSFTRLGVIFILVGFVGFLLWAAFAPLDAGVTARGTITVEGKRKTIQHLTGGIIQEILVKEGDKVKKGQTLLRLERVQIEAQQQITQTQLVSAKALEIRLLAERADDPAPSFNDYPVLQNSKGPSVREAIKTQTALFKTRRQAQEGQLSILDTTIEGLQQQLQGLEAQEKSRADQTRILNEQLASLRPLYKKGYVPRDKIFDLERAVAETSAQHSANLADAGRTRAALNEARLKKLQINQDFRKDIETQLAETQRDASALSEKLTALNDEVTRTEIRAPTDGIVVGLNFHTIGGVIRAGDPILDIVPQGEALVIDAQIMPHLIEKVTQGMPAAVRFVALDRMNPVVEGKVINVSPDILVEKNGQPYYAARISIPQEEMLKLKYDRIDPGMPVDVVIKTGERTMLAYLLRPLYDSMFLSLHER